jgi:hypothetical protein
MTSWYDRSLPSSWTRRNKTSHLGLESSARSSSRTTLSCREGEGFPLDKVWRGESTNLVRKRTVSRRENQSERSSQQRTSLCDRIRAKGTILNHASSRPSWRNYPASTTTNNILRDPHSAQHPTGCEGSKGSNCSRNSWKNQGPHLGM